MLALNITNLKDFTNKLFIGEVFDHFLVTEASITTFGTFLSTESFRMIFLILMNRLLFTKVDVLTLYGKK